MDAMKMCSCCQKPLLGLRWFRAFAAVAESASFSGRVVEESGESISAARVTVDLKRNRSIPSQMALGWEGML